MSKIDFEKWDKLYRVDMQGSWSVDLTSVNAALVFDHEVPVSEAFESMIKSGKKKPFHVSPGSESLEAYTLARMLNEELKIVTSSRYVNIFGNLDHYVSKQPIVYDSSYERSDRFADEAVSVANQVYFLEDIKPGYEKLVNKFRRELCNMLRTGNRVTLEDILNTEARLD